MHSKIVLFILFVIMLHASVQAQDDFQIWTTYNQQARISKKWGYGIDLNYRTRGLFPFNASVSAARMGINFQLDPNTRITAGYAWFGTHINDHTEPWLVENRLYQQIQFNNKKGDLQYVHRIRLEQRYRHGFINNTNDETKVFFSFRARYLFQMQGPLKKQTGTEKTILSWQAANEILLHTGQNIDYNIFDQNRTLAGIVIHPNPKTDIALLYQFILQRPPILLSTQAINSVRLTLFHNLDFRK
jgi:hypothetical protein